MSKPAYTFTIDVTAEQKELLLSTFNSRCIAIYKGEIEVFIGIVEILYRNGFSAFMDGMHRKETGFHFNWEVLIKYKTVVDFQLEWAYA